MVRAAQPLQPVHLLEHMLVTVEAVKGHPPDPAYEIAGRVITPHGAFAK